MDDLDQLLRSRPGRDIARAAEGAAEPPDFALLQRHGTRRRRARMVLASAAAVLAVVAVLGAVQLVGGSQAQPAVPTAPPLTHAMPSGDAALEPGTYAVQPSLTSAVSFTLTFAPGWSVQYGSTYYRQATGPAEIMLAARTVDTIYADACRGENGAETKIGPSAADLVAALLAQPGADVTGPTRTTLGGLPTTRVDLQFPTGRDMGACSYPGAGLQIWHQDATHDFFVLLPNGRASVYVLDVHGRRQVFVTQYTTDSSTADRASLQQVIGSIRFP
jgi:hypothetical protein